MQHERVRETDFNEWHDEQETVNIRTEQKYNTEHKFVTLYVFNLAQNIFIYYSVRFFTYGNKK